MSGLRSLYVRTGDYHRVTESTEWDGGKSKTKVLKTSFLIFSVLLWALCDSVVSPRAH
jgi:hypothetical protein